MVGPVVTSPSFSKNELLVSELRRSFPDAKINSDGGILRDRQLIEYCLGYEAMILGTERLSKDVIDSLPDLKFVAKYGVGLDNVDQEALASRGIGLGWTGGVNRRSVSEMALCFMIGLCRNILSTSYKLKSGEWDKRGGFQLSQKTVGIVGCGFIGTDLLELLQPFGCKILICDVEDRSEQCRRFGARQCDFYELLQQSDIVTLHVPLTPDTRQMMNEETLGRMKESAFLINTSRGGVLDEAALASALSDGKIAAAAVDVYGEEPSQENPLHSLPNFIGTPHIGGNAKEAVLAMGRSAIRHLQDWHRARPETDGF
jgi:phosphoglycerate dehydrogenase-like enzyme